MHILFISQALNMVSVKVCLCNIFNIIGHYIFKLNHSKGISATGYFNSVISSVIAHVTVVNRLSIYNQICYQFYNTCTMILLVIEKKICI